MNSLSDTIIFEGQTLKVKRKEKSRVFGKSFQENECSKPSGLGVLRGNLLIMFAMVSFWFSY